MIQTIDVRSLKVGDLIQVLNGRITKIGVSPISLPKSVSSQGDPIPLPKPVNLKADLPPPLPRPAELKH